jgi:amidase
MDNLANVLKMLSAFEITSVELVQMVKDHCVTMANYNAVCCLSPLAHDQAVLLDEERKNGIVRSPLHGVPILIKDNIFYNDGTPNTANSYSLHDLFPSYNAFVVTKLIEAGLIIIGKTNQSELSYFMSDNLPSGYGSMYGKVEHPFDNSIDPLGSSTGSAAAIKLNIVCISLGSETEGSLMAPASRCQVTSFKPSFGRVSRYGVIPVSSFQDTVGPMSQDVFGCAMLMDIIDKEDPNDMNTLNIPRVLSYLSDINTPLGKRKVGILYFSNEYNKQERLIVRETRKRLLSMGHQVVDINAGIPHIYSKHVMLIEFKKSLNDFLQYNNTSKMKSLKDIIEFNINNRDRCLKYGQNLLIESEEYEYDVYSPVYKHLKKVLLEEAELIENVIVNDDLIAVYSPWWINHAPIYGNPSICIPEGMVDGIPQSTIFIGRKYDDITLIRFAHQYQIKK